jgi:predicted acylesterase/phospholipase RssA
MANFIKNFFSQWSKSKSSSSTPEVSRQNIESKPLKRGLVLSGGGVRAAYQVGALKALSSKFESQENLINVIVGSSIGSINGLILGAALSKNFGEGVSILELLWKERTYRNTFSGHPSAAFFRAMSMAINQWISPGPKPTNKSIFDPTPLYTRVDSVIQHYGGLNPDQRAPCLDAIGIMTTIEGQSRKPLLFVSTSKSLADKVAVGATFSVSMVSDIGARHGFASAALPSVLPPVELDTEAGTVKLVDGGISQNVPVDPAVRLGAQEVYVIDISGRDWWLNRTGDAHDTRPKWEIAADDFTHCEMPEILHVYRCRSALGSILKQSVHGSTRKFMRAVGPVWPLFSLLKNKLGEEIAYEVMSYVALDEDYQLGLMETGFSETMTEIMRRGANEK